jgi:hypothetical protein
MAINLTRIDYEQLNARQKENYNFLKIGAVLADYGFMTMRLSDDWQGADFIAQHVDGASLLRVQLKSRLTFCKKYEGKSLHIAFPHNGDWYLYPHDELLSHLLGQTEIAATESWIQQGAYSFPSLSQRLFKILEPYKLDSNNGQAIAAHVGK